MRWRFLIDRSIYLLCDVYLFQVSNSLHSATILDPRAIVYNFSFNDAASTKGSCEAVEMCKKRRFALIASDDSHGLKPIGWSPRILGRGAASLSALRLHLLARLPTPQFGRLACALEAFRAPK